MKLLNLELESAGGHCELAITTSRFRPIFFAKQLTPKLNFSDFGQVRVRGLSREVDFVLGSLRLSFRLHESSMAGNVFVSLVN